MTRRACQAWLTVAWIACSIGCAWNFERSTQVVHTKRYGAPALRADIAGARAEVAEDGRFRVTLPAAFCSREVHAEAQTFAVTDYQLSWRSIPYVVFLASIGIGGAYLVVTSSEGVADRDNAKFIPGLFALLGGLCGAGGVLSAGLAPSKYVGEAPITKSSGKFEPIRCMDQFRGDITLTTPWGATSAGGTIGATTTVVAFEIDWTGVAAIDPKTQLAGPWKLAVDRHGVLASVQLADADVARAAKQVAASRDRTIVGKTPASLVTKGFTTDRDTLLAGGSVRAHMIVENRGGSTARNVVVRSRSSLVELHGLELSLGTIQPGRAATVTRTIALPNTVTGDSATIVFSFSDASGQAHADISQQLALTRAPCADGRLTRKQYENKRAELQRQVDRGALKQDDLLKLDAELLRCVE